MIQTTLDQEDALVALDADVIARQVIAGREKLGLVGLKQIDLAAAITAIFVDDTIVGSSTLTITLADPDWDLMDSGFFDSDKNGKLDAIDLNYPENSPYWWR